MPAVQTGVMTWPAPEDTHDLTQTIRLAVGAQGNNRWKQILTMHKKILTT
jgi:hypothetical protein